MYMNASVHIAKPNAPRANGIGALPSQHTGSQPGAVNRRASQTFAKYRSASTGGVDDRSSSDRVRCPDPPQMSIARRAAAEHRRRRRPAHDRLRDDVGRIGEAVEEVAALEIGPERVDHLAVRRRVGRGRGVEGLGLRVVVEAEHRAPRQVGAPGLDLIARGGRRRLQVQHRDAVDDREDAAVAAEDAVVNLVAARCR